MRPAISKTDIKVAIGTECKVTTIMVEKGLFDTENDFNHGFTVFLDSNSPNILASSSSDMRSLQEIAKKSMRKLVTHFSLSFFCLVILAGCGGNGSGSNQPIGNMNVALAPAFDALIFSSPLALLQPPDDTSRWFVIEKGGRVLTFANDDGVSTSSIFIDITGHVESTPNEA